MRPETEPLRLAETLLRQCLADFSPIFACHAPLSRASCKKGATQQDRGVGDYEGCRDVDFLRLCHDIVGRLNVLVLLSQAVFTRLQQAVPRLRRVFLVAVYRVLSLALCNGQRAVRCAGIRCLRHYVRSNSDVDLLLSNRLDLFITRCFDLSYESGLSAAESFECKGRNVAAANTSLPQPAQQAALHARLPTLFGNRLMRPEFRRRIQPGSRLRSTSEDRTGSLFSIELLLSPPSIEMPMLGDTFTIIEMSRLADSQDLLNGIFFGIQFTRGDEDVVRLPSLDILITRRPNGELSTAAYTKATNTSQVLNYHNNHPIARKRGCARAVFQMAGTHFSEPEERVRESVSETTERFSAELGVGIAHRPTATIRTKIMQMKDRLDAGEQPGVVSQITYVTVLTTTQDRTEDNLTRE
ncbi:hypothetical protein SprV_0501874100 [Sparganum proliferum]